MKDRFLKRRRTAPAPWALDVETTVRDLLYGEHADRDALAELRERLLGSHGGPGQLRAA